MPTFTAIIVALVVAALLGCASALVRRALAGTRSRERLFAEEPETLEPRAVESAGDDWLRRWLFLAGYRSAAALALFVAATLAAAGVGLAMVYVVHQVALTTSLSQALAHLPPGVADLFLPMVYLTPWLVFAGLAVLPWLGVRRARRQRVELVEQDLPICLELLSTMSEAGLGFDAALSRMLESVIEDRPLAREFRSYQADLLAGRTRVEALRRLARRLEVSSVTILVSALVQAEQLGMGIAHALRWQADDLRNRRRERANAFAMALPVKRMFPLVICFLPGVFIWTLGPFFVRLFQFAETFMRGRGF